MNLTGVNEEQAELIKDLISAIHPLACIFDVTIDSLSKTLFTPTKDCAKNMMMDGLFGSLVDGSLLVVNETTLGNGEFSMYGVPNMMALQNLNEFQLMQLDFKYSQTEL